jgi:hypothetical protein
MNVYPMVVSNRIQLDGGRRDSLGMESWLPMPSKEPFSPRSFFRTDHNISARLHLAQSFLVHFDISDRSHRRVLGQLVCCDKLASNQMTADTSDLRILPLWHALRAGAGDPYPSPALAPFSTGSIS